MEGWKGEKEGQNAKRARRTEGSCGRRLCRAEPKVPRVPLSASLSGRGKKGLSGRSGNKKLGK